MTKTFVCALDELEVDQAIRVDIENVSVAVIRDSHGVVHALGDLCSHGDISLAEGFVEGDTIECWAHGSKFSLTSGKPLTLPAFEAVPVFSVTIESDNVFVDIDTKI